MWAPIIVSSQAGVSKIVSAGVDGFILNDPFDSVRLAERTALPYGNRGLRQTTAKTARQHTCNRSAEQLSQFFQQVPRQRRRRQHTHPRRAGCVMTHA